MTKVKSRFSSPGSVHQWHLQTKHVNEGPCFGEGWGEGSWRFGKGNRTEFAFSEVSVGEMKRKFTTHPKHQQIPPGSFSPWDHLTLSHSEWSSNKHVNLSHQTSRQPACTLVQWAPTRLSSPSSGFQPLSLEGWQQSYPAVQPCCNSLRQIFSPAPCSGYLLWVLPESKTKGSPCQFELVLQATSDLILSFRSYCNK